MICPERESLLAHADGLLDAAESAAMESHLTGCAECRTAGDDYIRIGRALGALAGLWSEDETDFHPSEPRAAREVDGPLGECLRRLDEARSLCGRDWLGAETISEEVRCRMEALAWSRADGWTDRGAEMLGADALGLRGYCRIRTGRIPEGLVDLRNALTFWESHGEPYSASCVRINLAIGEMLAKNLQTARNLAWTAANTLALMGQSLECAQARQVLGICLNDLGRPKDAREEFSLAIGEFQAVGRKDLEAMTMRELADVSFQIGDANAAGALLNSAIPVLREHGLTLDALRCEVLLGVVEASREPPVDGAKRIRQARDQFIAEGFWLDAAHATCRLIESFSDRRGTAAAQELNRLRESLPADQENRWIREEIQRLETSIGQEPTSDEPDRWRHEIADMRTRMLKGCKLNSTV